MSSGERGRAQSSGGNQQRTQYHNSSARMKMKISMLLFLLLLLPLLAADSNHPVSVVKGCQDMWLEFTCKCAKCGSQGVKVELPGRTLTLTHSNVWIDFDERLSLYYSKTNRTVRLLIKKLQMADIGEYKCFHTNTKSSEEDEATKKQVKQEFVACHSPEGFAQTAYRGVGTTITCNYPGNNLSKNIYLCKDIKTRECIESKVSRTTQAGLSVAMTQVSSADQGVYWCSFRKYGYKGAYQKIVLSVKDVFTHSATVTAGDTFIYSYNYLSFNVSSGRRGTQPKKFLCKGEDPTTCSRWWIGEPEVIDNQQLSSVTVTLRAVTPAHNGTYWCGAQTEGRRSSLIFYRLQLQVVSPPSPLPTLKTQAASPFCSSARELWLAVVAAMVCVALLLLALTLTLVYICHQRRKWREWELQRRQHSQEETAYTEVEMQQPHHQAAPGIASKTIYSCAGAADLHDVPVEENGGDTYSVVRDSEQAPTYSTVGHPTGPLAVAAAAAFQDPSDDSTPLYHTVVQH